MNSDIEDYWQLTHAKAIEGIGIDENAPYGILIIYAPEGWQGLTFDLEEKFGNNQKYYANIVKRNISGEWVWYAFFPKLMPGNYYSEFIRSIIVTIWAGHISEVDWRNG